MKSLLLFSGGLDSAALAAWKRPEFCLTVDYGQLAANAEIQAAKNISKDLGLRHEILRVDCRALGSGEMVNEKRHSKAPMPEWWPYRNQLLLTFAAGMCAKFGAKRILVGAVKSDSTHRDGTGMFFKLANDLISYQELHLEVKAPAIKMRAADLVVKSKLSVDNILMAHSCHQGNLPCSVCRGCQKKYQILRQLKIEL